MARPSILKYRDKLSYMKEFIFENIIDKENKKKISDREFLRTKSNELTLSGEPLQTNVWTYWTKHPDIVKCSPMKGKRICEQTIYEYAIEKGYWTEEEIPYDDFTNNTMKIKNKLDEMTLMRKVCNEFNYPTKPLNEGVFTIKQVEDSLKYTHTEEVYNKVKSKLKRELLKR